MTSTCASEETSLTYCKTLISSAHLILRSSAKTSQRTRLPASSIAKTPIPSNEGVGKSKPESRFVPLMVSKTLASNSPVRTLLTSSVKCTSSTAYAAWNHAGGLIGPIQAAYSLGNRGTKSTECASLTRMAARHPGSFTPKRYWKLLSCRKSQFVSVSYFDSSSPPCSSTTASSGISGRPRSASQRPVRFLWCIRMGTLRVPAPMEKKGSLGSNLSHDTVPFGRAALIALTLADTGG